MRGADINYLTPPTSRKMAAAEQAGGAEYEAQNVHDVYEQIATHFSATRYKVRYTSHHPERAVLTCEM